LTPNGLFLSRYELRSGNTNARSVN
jgi:hypothetical protein